MFGLVRVLSVVSLVHVILAQQVSPTTKPKIHSTETKADHTSSSSPTSQHVL
jgi:hypothetical protein